MLLLAALAALFAGPLLYSSLSHANLSHQALDRVLVFSIVVLLAAGTVPHAVEEGGWVVLVFLVAGFALPFAMEQGLRQLAWQAHIATLAVAIGGVTLHSVVDGAAVAEMTNNPNVSWSLFAAVVLHRLPVAAAVWWLVRPQFGLGWGFASLVGLVGATLVGYLGGHRWLPEGNHLFEASFELFVAGALLHVALNRNHSDHNH
jgi:hypothetical protein